MSGRQKRPRPPPPAAASRAAARREPRRIGPALDAVVAGVRPATLLARLQEAWPVAVGPVLAGEARPVAERGGVVTVECRSAAWAQELELMSRDLLERLRAALGEGARGPAGVRELRVVAGGRPRGG